MIIGILTIGDELINGMVVETNSVYISRMLGAEGWQTAAKLSVGDDEQAIRKGLSYALDVSDALIVTGGLGPTVDDITTEVVAGILNRPLYADRVVLEFLKTRFRKLNLRWTENNVKQAYFPEGAETIPNPVGTAWGFFIRCGKKLVIVLPGVPTEVRAMIPHYVIPLLRKEDPRKRFYTVKKTFKLFGITESRIDEVITNLDLKTYGVAVGFYPQFPEVHIVLSKGAETEAEALSGMQAAERLVAGHLQKYIFGYEQDTLEGVVAALLSERKMTLAVAESCTGGLISDHLTDVAGSSAFYERGVVTYSNQSKSMLLGVPVSVVNEYGAVSEETARLMAEGARKSARTDLGLATTGIAGPSGGTESKPVGTVFIALADSNGTFCRKFGFGGHRRRIKELASHWALECLRRHLLEGEQNEG